MQSVSSPMHPYIYLRPWPLTSKTNRVCPLVVINMSAKFDKDAHNG